ncbi:MAG: CDP-alcohol phosphatidyltransferase family protein [Gemmatimonadales bacterium]|nr:CDP-alcohol phosphatidyltransferase family protein [Gemmatimonadales bacterium]MDZ4389413.1 CDP-alcohol phosphatidyltransferase family protein [Gemmatimonadales bacterium]
MSFNAVLRIPELPEAENPAFLRVAGVVVLTRLIAGAHAAGSDRIVVVGSLAERARDLIGTDRRVRNAPVSWVEHDIDLPTDGRVTITAPANLVAGTRTWQLLADADAPAAVPVAPAMRSAGEGTPRPIWEGRAPHGAYAAPVETKADVAAAKKTIFSHVTKVTSGPISRHFNSLLSLPVSRTLCELGVTPNQMTIFTSMLGLLSAVFIAQGTMKYLAIGGTLFQLCAMFDRVDGELARSTFTASEHGAWIDTIGDNLVYVAVVIGLNVGYYRFALAKGWPEAAWIPEFGTAMVLLLLLLIGGMAWYLRATGQRGTMTAVQHDLADRLQGADAGITYRLLTAISVLGKRDSFSFVAWIITLVPWLTREPTRVHALVAFVDGGVVLVAFYYIWGMVKVAQLAPEPRTAGSSSRG